MVAPQSWETCILSRRNCSRRTLTSRAPITLVPNCERFNSPSSCTILDDAVICSPDLQFTSITVLREIVQLQGAGLLPSHQIRLIACNLINYTQFALPYFNGAWYRRQSTESLLTCFRKLRESQFCQLFDYLITIEDEFPSTLPSLHAHPVYKPRRMVTFYTSHYCVKHLNINFLVIHIIGVVAAELLLILRTYAFWHGDKRLLYGLLSYAVVTICAAIAIDTSPTQFLPGGKYKSVLELLCLLTRL
ncbi:hypothetical protein BU15DRAFT_63290 [Melanogaster broomeanus]|nr:hypothetical protein BU15DRAFT_63290 [Melanogaster broomeanus]